MRELLRLIALALCLASLWILFHVLFLAPGPAEPAARTWDFLVLGSLAAGIAVSAGMLDRTLDRGHAASRSQSLLASLPVRTFLWGISILTLLFVASWYLETHCIFYRDLRRL